MSDEDKTQPTFKFENNFAGASNITLAQGQYATALSGVSIDRQLEELRQQVARLSPEQRHLLEPIIQDAALAQRSGNTQHLRERLTQMLMTVGTTADLLTLGDHYQQLHDGLTHLLRALGGGA